MKTATESENSLLNQQNLTVINITHNLLPENISKHDKVIQLDNGTLKSRTQKDGKKNLLNKLIKIKQ